MLQYKIPQDVELADKILGPLTLKQLLIIVAGGGISYSIFLILSGQFYLGVFDYFWIVIPLLISVAFAFLRINDVTFLKWLLLLFEYNHNARRRRWDKTETARLHFAFVGAKTETKVQKTEKKLKVSVPGKKKFSSLEEITYLLDHSSKFPEEQKQVADDHDADHSLHLSSEEKTRQEERLEKSILAQDAVRLETPAEPVTAVAKPSVAETPPTPPIPETRAVDTVLNSDSSAPHVISFPDLREGGQVSFSS